jgi:hypothetical protein
MQGKFQSIVAMNAYFSSEKTGAMGALLAT